MSKPSNELLQQFVGSGSQSAFEELVSTHVDLVYATALRVVNGNSGLAGDIAQTVFIDFARKPPFPIRPRRRPGCIARRGWRPSPRFGPKPDATSASTSPSISKPSM